MIYLISRVFCAWPFLNFLASTVNLFKKNSWNRIFFLILNPRFIVIFRRISFLNILNFPSISRKNNWNLFTKKTLQIDFFFNFEPMIHREFSSYFNMFYFYFVGIRMQWYRDWTSWIRRSPSTSRRSTY